MPMFEEPDLSVSEIVTALPAVWRSSFEGLAWRLRLAGGNTVGVVPLLNVSRAEYLEHAVGGNSHRSRHAEDLPPLLQRLLQEGKEVGK